MFFKEFEIRWSDTDANRHLANSAYINYNRQKKEMPYIKYSELEATGIT